MGDKVDQQFERIGAVLGDDAEQDLSTSVQTFFEHLQRFLTLPCEVTGVEDFQWEEYYVIGPGSQKEYARSISSTTWGRLAGVISFWVSQRNEENTVYGRFRARLNERPLAEGSYRSRQCHKPHPFVHLMSNREQRRAG